MTIATAACTADSTIIGYLLQALAADGTYDYKPGLGLPPSTVRLDRRGVILSVTAAASPSYRARAADLAAALACDVVLLRMTGIDEDFVHVAADMTLGLVPGGAPSFSGYTPWERRDGRLWLVPEGFGPAVAVDADGFTVELDPPYHTQAQRTAGVLRAAGALAQLYRPAGIR